MPPRKGFPNVEHAHFAVTLLVEDATVTTGSRAMLIDG
jgi:hypothetical protein